MSSRTELRAEIAGRLAREALAAGAGEVCATFRRSFYLRLPGERYACIGERALGCGPLNALVPAFALPAIGDRVKVDAGSAALWTPAPVASAGPAKLDELRRAARGRVPAEGLGCLVVGEHNAVATHAQPGVEALERWLVGNALEAETEILLGLGPGLTPSGDDFLGGVLIALRACGRAAQADALWRWLQPRLAARTSAISAAHLAAAAQGEGHEALHRALTCLFAGTADWPAALDALGGVGHCSGWDGLAGAAAVARLA